LQLFHCLELGTCSIIFKTFYGKSGGNFCISTIKIFIALNVRKEFAGVGIKLIDRKPALN
jgi:hypothetical protein